MVCAGSGEHRCHHEHDTARDPTAADTRTGLRSPCGLGRDPRPGEHPPDGRRPPPRRRRRRWPRPAPRHRPADRAGRLRGPHLLRRSRARALHRVLAARARGGQRLGARRARPPQPHRGARPGRRARGRHPARPHVVGQRVSLGAADRRRHRRPDRHRLPAARPHRRDGREHHEPRGRPARGPDADLRRTAHLRRAAATGQPAQEGADPVLVRARGHGRRARRAGRRRPRRCLGRPVGVPGAGAGTQRRLPAARGVLGTGRRHHPGRTPGRRPPPSAPRSATSGTRTATWCGL